MWPRLRAVSDKETQSTNLNIISKEAKFNPDILHSEEDTQIITLLLASVPSLLLLPWRPGSYPTFSTLNTIPQATPLDTDPLSLSLSSDPAIQTPKKIGLAGQRRMIMGPLRPLS